MFVLMAALTLAGLALLLGGPALARLLTRRRDAVGLARVLQALGIALLVAALLARPRNPETAAFPAPPDDPRQAAP